MTAAAAPPQPPAPGRWHLPAAVGILVLALGGAALGWSQLLRAQSELRAQMLSRTELRAMQLADAMNGQMAMTVAALDTGLQELRRAWTDDRASFDRAARGIVATLPPGAVGQVTVTDARGQVVYASPGGVAPERLADAAHVGAHQGGGDRLHVGEALRSRQGDARWTVTVSRPLLDGGRFVGTVNLAVPADFLAAQLAALSLSPADVVALVHPGGRMIARSRDQALAVGRQLPPDRPFLRDPTADRGLFRVPGEVDGIARIYGWRRQPGAGLVSAVGLAESEALAPVVARQGEERRVLLALTALALLAAAGVALLLWQSGRRQKALSLSEQRYRTLLDSAPDAIFLSRDDVFTYVNPAAVRFFGADDERQLLGTRTMDRVHPDDRAAVSARRGQLDGGQAILTPRAGRYLRLDGTALDVEATASVYRDGQGLCHQVIVRDVTARRAAERALQRMTDELEQRVAERTAALSAARDEAESANRAKSEFLSRMSHELRTPLNAILGFGQLLELDRSLDEGPRGRVREILLAGRHLLQLINDVLDLSRIEGGQFEVSLEDVALGPLLHETATLVRQQAEPVGVRIEVGAAADAAIVRADRTRLRQVLLNLLSNAVKYNRRGGGVRLGLVPAGEALWRIEVEDDGAGLDEGQIARLFRPFERLDAARSGIEGTGIGLALSRHLVELMHGRIGVRSRPGEGSCFWVELPAGRAGPVVLPPAPPPAAAPAAGEADRCVLQIEDNPANRALVQGIVGLRPRWRLLSAALPSEGLALAAGHRPDLVLLDLHLPEMDGFEVLRRLRGDPRTRGIPVVAVSANAMGEDLVRGRDAGFDGYLTKPLDVGALLALLDARA